MKKTIANLLVLCLLLSGCATPKRINITSDWQRLITAAQEDAKLLPLSELELPDRYSGKTIRVGGVDMTVDADIRLPEAERIPAATVTNRKLTQQEADRILRVLVGDAEFLMDDSDEPANRNLSKGAIQGRIPRQINRYKRTDAHLRITEDGVCWFRDPFGSYERIHYITEPQQLFETAEKTSALSEEETCAQAAALAEQLGVPGEFRSVNTVLFSADTPGISRWKGQKVVTLEMEQGRMVEYTSVLNGVPIYDIDIRWIADRAIPSEPAAIADDGEIAGGWYTDADTDAPVQRIGFGFSDNPGQTDDLTRGLRWFEWRCPYAEPEIAVEDCRLLPFETVMEIFTAACEAEPETLQSKLYLKEISDAVISEISLNLMYVRHPEKQDVGLLIPVWDFWADIEGVDHYHNSESMHRVMLTLNAIDGSIMDRVHAK